MRTPLPVKQYASLVTKALCLSRPRILAKRDAGGALTKYQAAVDEELATMGT
jgi:hypothetical protein